MWLLRAAQDQFTAGEQGLQLVEHTGNAWIYRRPDALPLARLVLQCRNHSRNRASHRPYPSA